MDPEEKARKLRERAFTVLKIDGGSIMFLNEVRPTAEYKVLNMAGAVHTPVFNMQLEVDGQVFDGDGSTKKKAKAIAAEKAIRALLPEYADAFSRVGNESFGGSQAEVPIKCEVPIKRKVPIKPMATGTSPVAILQQLRSDLVYDVLEQPPEPAPVPPVNSALFKLGATVDGVRFEAEGVSMRVARAKVAEAVLSSLFGLHCEEGRGGIPVFMGEDIAWMSLRPLGSRGTPMDAVPRVTPMDRVPRGTPMDGVPLELGFTLPGDKNPVMFLHEVLVLTSSLVRFISAIFNRN